ncbi:beta-xylosidase [Sphaerisporangium melleum]|uniref:Beta-xylosidase n=1 Tax=Sphaerisporangium melleum TaxID=321316 RepID=A0A917RAK5_9ACTN|nr:RICIN domain-containing protein [Sphaerisporangium melleum]GGK97453.1 beta-xylosidase [Sphaerisporangium melleum]GII71125.1 beta-xylosidase [Sphaerisporangium melleum]
MSRLQALLSRRTTGRMVALALALVAAMLGPGVVPEAGAATVTVTNRTQFRDTSGNVVHAHGGGVIKVGDYYYWFGESRNADSTFRAVTVYRSQDLRTWEFRNNALTQASASELGVANIERPKVIYNASTRQFVMWMHKENGRDYGEARAAVATSSTVDGTYTYRGSFRPFNQHMSRDITAFVDDDGAGYMVSAARENADLHIYRLTADYTNVASLVRVWQGDTREAPALFKRGGVYFMLTSGATGWNPNQQKYSTATSLAGPWSAWQNAGDSTTYGSQTMFVLPVQGTQTTSYLYMGDRWGPGFGAAYADSQYVWLPLRFPSATSLALDWYPQITVDTETGVVAGVASSAVNLVARHSGKCADVVNGSAALSAEVIQYTCGSGANQQWSPRDAGGGYVQLVAQHSGLCLDVANVSTADGAKVVQYTCGSGTNQQWQFQDAGGGYYRLVARHSGRCLDVTDGSTADGARLIQWSCNGGTNQQWQRRAR